MPLASRHFRSTASTRVVESRARERETGAHLQGESVDGSGGESEVKALVLNHPQSLPDDSEGEIIPFVRGADTPAAVDLQEFGRRLVLQVDQRVDTELSRIRHESSAAIGSFRKSVQNHLRQDMKQIAELNALVKADSRAQSAFARIWWWWATHTRGETGRVRQSASRDGGKIR